MCSIEGLRLVSHRFRELVEEHLTPWDDVQWVPGQVRDADGQHHQVWLVHFPTRRGDLLDESRTLRPGPGVPTIRVLAREKVEGLSFFTDSYMSMGVYVNGYLMRALRRAKLRGFTVKYARMWRPDEQNCPTHLPPDPG
jgi:hypothetical protein